MDGVAGALLVAVTGYAIGSVPSALIVSAVVGRSDPRSVGSGNPGAMNVLRNVGVVAGVLTAAADVLKGYLAVRLGAWFWTTLVETPVAAAPSGQYLAGVMAVAGHNWPLFGRWRGGKGIATSAGAYLSMSLPALTVLAALVGGASLAAWDVYSGTVGGYWLLAAMMAFPAVRAVLGLAVSSGPVAGWTPTVYAAAVAALVTAKFAPDCKPWWRTRQTRG
ncbi:MAG: glycerol-3-phosphate acyltransferase [Firmicutes bacterium]|nr:glycerol-3-phosphate acyltransferase [Bacillota bacterium]